MKTHQDAEKALSDIAQNLQQTMDQKNARANVIVAGNKMQTINEYVLLFVSNFSKIIKEYNLTKTEILIVLKMLELMQFGNLISISNNTIAKALEMDKGNVSRVLKKLKKTELIVDMDGSLFFNPHIACKGFLDERLPDDRQLLDYSAIIFEEINSPATPSIATKNIRNKIRKSEKKVSSEEIKQKIAEHYGLQDN